ncbi:histone H1-like [Lolium rigidum]|uniref:histone H1-like n=1 Tax=Lolium rigidum TaxID=89674 RepID=UPI001F5C790C|nr:histone H1-like [Lolium rigidum]
MATVTEEGVAVPAVGAGEAEAVMQEKVVEAGKVEEKVEEAKEAGAGEEKAEGDAKKPEAEVEQGTAKAKKPRSRKPRSEGPNHPPYFEMIKEAIMADGKAEASTYAIAKRVGERHGDALPGNYRKVLAVQLRNFAAKGRLVRVKASFRLAPAEEKKASKKRRGTATRKAASNSKKAAPAPAPAPARAKRAKKKAPPAKPKPKQPKSIRAGAARKANKASA